MFLISGDPILEGLVTNLSRPQGALTGLITRGEELTANACNFLKEAFPGIRTVAIVGSNLSSVARRFRRVRTESFKLETS